MRPVLFAICALLSGSLLAQGEKRAEGKKMFVNPLSEPKDIVINNRPLVKVQDKTISLMDVVKRMNLLIRMHNPEYFESKAMLFQFYNSQWRNTLEMMINNVLICAQAEEKKVKLHEGDIRKEMETRFGPNVTATIHELGMEHNEAREYVESTLVEQQMMWLNVYRRVWQLVTPTELKNAYSNYTVANPPKESWTYQVMTIRNAPDQIEEHLATVATQVFNQKLQQLKSENNEVVTQIQLLKDHPEIKISLSNELTVERSAASKELISVLDSLTPDELSAPKKQHSRADGTDVLRLYYLKDHEKLKVPEFAEISKTLQDQLFNHVAEAQRTQYLQKLRKHFRMDGPEVYEMIPKDFVPFALVQ